MIQQISCKMKDFIGKFMENKKSLPLRGRGFFLIITCEKMIQMLEFVGFEPLFFKKHLVNF